MAGAPYLPHTAAPKHGLEAITADVFSAAQLPLHLVEPGVLMNGVQAAVKKTTRRVAGHQVPRCRRIAQNSRRQQMRGRKHRGREERRSDTLPRPAREPPSPKRRSSRRLPWIFPAGAGPVDRVFDQPQSEGPSHFERQPQVQQKLGRKNVRTLQGRETRRRQHQKQGTQAKQRRPVRRQFRLEETAAAATPKTVKAVRIAIVPMRRAPPARHRSPTGCRGARAVEGQTVSGAAQKPARPGRAWSWLTASPRAPSSSGRFRPPRLVSPRVVSRP